MPSCTIVRVLTVGLLSAAFAARAETSAEPALDEAHSDDRPALTAVDASSPAPTSDDTIPKVTVSGYRYNSATRLRYSLPEVDGPIVTVTRKTSVSELDDLPPTTVNGQRQLFSRLPGLFVSEQQTPSKLDINYRGIGNPQEGEYLLLLNDGVPMASDAIGFPTNYFLPLPETLSQLSFIRGGAGLLYGPEPSGAILYQSVPLASGPGLRLDVTVGSAGLLSQFLQLHPTSGNWSLLGSEGQIRSSGIRVNGGYQVLQDTAAFQYEDGLRRWTVRFSSYRMQSGDPGRLSFPQWSSDPEATTTPNNRDWVQRQSGSLRYQDRLGPGIDVDALLWHTGSFQTERSSTSSTSTIDRQDFSSNGMDVRFGGSPWERERLTAGFSWQHTASPWRQSIDQGPVASDTQLGGVPFLDQYRTSQALAFFAESLTRFDQFHLLASVRHESDEVSVDESHRPPFLSRPLIDTDQKRSVWLSGLGLGNDFGRGNETYVNVSQGYRPLRYLDVASPFSNLNASAMRPDPSQSVTYEAGVHGWPSPGLYYDVSAFEVQLRNRIETIVLSPTESVNTNTGNTVHRGLEAQLQTPLGFTGPIQWSGNVSASLLNARFVSSATAGQTGKTPAYAPRSLLKSTLTASQGNTRVNLGLQYVAHQYWQDSDQPLAAPGALNYIPALIPATTLVDLAMEHPLTSEVTLHAGVTNLGNRRYYSRVWQNGIDPGMPRTVTAGLRIDAF